MKASHYYIETFKEVPSEAELPSHQLMLRAGLIRKIAAGLYTWMPLGLRVLKKIERIVREEMNQAGAIELLMPTVQPSSLWQESGRWQKYGKELLRFQDRHGKDFCYGPTHEEVITDLMRNHLTSYKQMPINFYQIQMKFRDEIRPRFGVMRAREFIMKDGYSFHADEASLRETYQKMYTCYSNIFKRMGLKFRAVAADNGTIGGSSSHEFQVIAKNGEDLIAYSTVSDYAANIELTPLSRSSGERRPANEILQLKATPGVKTINALVAYLHISIKRTIKAIVVEGEKDIPVLLLLRGDHQLNEIKASHLKGVKGPLRFCSEEMLQDFFNSEGGFLGPFGFKGLVYADYALEKGSDWVVGANQKDHHYLGFNFGRDSTEPQFVDMRNAEEGDPSPDGQGTLKLARGIEVGHIFELGDQYSQAMQVKFLDQDSHSKTIKMGCYGLGISRVMAASIEQNHDDKGIIWPLALAPFAVVIVPMSYHKSALVKQYSDQLYQELMSAGLEVLLDDRDERAGVLLNDSELIGIPHRLVIGAKNLEKGVIEYQRRGLDQIEKINTENILSHLLNLINKV